jgi:EmrB/QacA subfamily drug resistance transporter
MAEPAPPAAGRGMSGGRVVLVFVGVLLTLLMSALDQTVVATAVWPMVYDLDPVNGLSSMSWVVIAYMLASTATQPIYGKLADLFGAKPVYLVAVILFLGGSVASGAAQTMGQLIGFRALQGLGAGGLYGVALVIIGLMTTPKQRAKFQGIGGAVVGVSTVAGPLIGGFITNDHVILGVHTSWRWLFYINLPLGAVALFVVLFLLRLPERRRSHDIDYLGAVLIAGGATSVLLLTEWGGDKYAWSSKEIIGLAIAAAVLLGGFVWRQTRAREPIMPPRLFRSRTVAVSMPILFLVGFALMGAIVYVSMYLQVVYDLTPTQSGLRMLAMTFGFMISAIGSGIIVSKLGRYKVFPIIGSILAAGGLALLSTLKADSSIVLLCVYVFLIGLGVGLLMQLVVLVVQNAVDRDDLGTATTSATFFRTLGQSFGAALFGAVLTNRLAHVLPADLGQGISGKDVSAAQLHALPPAARTAYIDAFVDAAGTVFLVAAIIMLASLVLAFFLPDIRLEDVDDSPDLGDDTDGTEPVPAARREADRETARAAGYSPAPPG